MIRGFRPIDCDVHPAVPGLKALLPFMEPYWADTLQQRGMHELDSISYPNNAPLTARADWRPADGSKPGATLEQVQRDLLDPFDVDAAILNCLYGVQLPFSEDMGAAYARAVNDWIKSEWLDRDPRLRASILIPIQSTEFAVAEIERLADDQRFVQVMTLVAGDTTLGRRHHWPIYEAAARHGLPLAIHAGSSYRHPPTAVGWSSYYIEDYASHAITFQSQLASLLAEGVFKQIPNLKVVMLESGITWLPGFLWRFEKYWRGLVMEIPWVDRPPGDIVADHVRFSLTPFDAPDDAETVGQLFEHLGSDELVLFSSDYPHWQYDGDDPLPVGITDELARKLLVENPRQTYARLA